MRVEDHTDSYTVHADPNDVSDFVAFWPACDLDEDAAYAFQFSKKNGDLVDIVATIDRKRVDISGHGSGGALVALSEDAGLFGATELGLTDLIALRYPDAASSPRP